MDYAEFGRGELLIILAGMVKQKRTYQGYLRKAIARNDVEGAKKWALQVTIAEGILVAIRRELSGY